MFLSTFPDEATMESIYSLEEKLDEKRALIKSLRRDLKRSQNNVDNKTKEIDALKLRVKSLEKKISLLQSRPYANISQASSHLGKNNFTFVYITTCNYIWLAIHSPRD